MKSAMLGATDDRPLRLDLAIFSVILALGFFAGLFEAGRSPDHAMVIQAETFMACMLAIGIF